MYLVEDGRRNTRNGTVQRSAVVNKWQHLFHTRRILDDKIVAVMNTPADPILTALQEQGSHYMIDSAKMS